MKYGIFGDVQGNYNNLEKMFKTCKEFDISSFICLGDIVHKGNTFMENRCIETIRKNNCKCVRGNHDELSETIIDSGKIHGDNLEFLESLPELVTLGGILFYHKPLTGSKMYTIEDAKKEFEKIESEERYRGVKFTFYGHTHDIKGFKKKENNISEINLKENDFMVGSDVILEDGWVYLFNPGSIGIPNSVRPSFGVLDIGGRNKTFEIKCL